VTGLPSDSGKRKKLTKYLIIGAVTVIIVVFVALLIVVLTRKDPPPPPITFADGMLKAARDNGLVGMSVLAMCRGAYTDEYQTGMADI